MSQSGYDIEYYGTDDIEYYDTDDDGLSKFIRALLGSLSIIGCMICAIYCLYKYAVCQEKKDRQNNISVTQYGMV